MPQTTSHTYSSSTKIDVSYRESTNGDVLQAVEGVVDQRANHHNYRVDDRNLPVYRTVDARCGGVKLVVDVTEIYFCAKKH